MKCVFPILRESLLTALVLKELLNINRDDTRPQCICDLICRDQSKNTQSPFNHLWCVCVCVCIKASPEATIEYNRESLQAFPGGKRKPTSGPIFMSQAERFGGNLPPRSVQDVMPSRLWVVCPTCSRTYDQLPRHWSQSGCAPAPEERAAALAQARQRAYALTANGSLRAEELEELRQEADPLRALCRRLGVVIVEGGEGAERAGVRRGSAGRVCITWETA